MKSFLIILFITIICFFGYYAIAKDKEDPPMLRDLDKHCECINYDCGCCSKLYIKGVLDGTLCSNFSYLPDQYGISVTITYNNLDIFNETVSAKNPPPICIIHIDDLKMEICLHFYNLDVKNKCFSGCAEFEVSFFKVLPLKKLKLGCFSCKGDNSIGKDLQYVLDYFKSNSKSYKEEPKVVLI